MLYVWQCPLDHHFIVFRSVAVQQAVGILIDHSDQIKLTWHVRSFFDNAPERRRLRSSVAPSTEISRCQRRQRFTGDLWHSVVALLFKVRELGCESAERRRLRSSVAPPTEISRCQRLQRLTGDLWHSVVALLFQSARIGMRVDGATSPT